MLYFKEAISMGDYIPMGGVMVFVCVALKRDCRKRWLFVFLLFGVLCVSDTPISYADALEVFVLLLMLSCFTRYSTSKNVDKRAIDTL